MSSSIPKGPRLFERKIFDHATAALEALQKCVESFSGESQGLFEVQLARFNLWASNIGTFAPYRTSLDCRLRDAPEITNVIVGLVDILKIYAKRGMYLYAKFVRNYNSRC
jgi:hypothetical protein